MLHFTPRPRARVVTVGPLSMRAFNNPDDAIAYSREYHERHPLRPWFRENRGVTIRAVGCDDRSFMVNLANDASFSLFADANTCELQIATFDVPLDMPIAPPDVIVLRTPTHERTWDRESDLRRFRERTLFGAHFSVEAFSLYLDGDQVFRFVVRLQIPSREPLLYWGEV